ncbi:MAG: YciI family protein [Burkholderiaceae bacterium]|nr:YciI family protein [Burkholderiaceae bacterium]
MKEYILLMHNDVAAEDAREDTWPEYLSRLRATGRFEGGSVIGDGICVKKSGSPGGITAKLGGYIRIRAESLDDARSFLPGNPVFEAGGTVEVRELPRGDA